MGYLKGKSTLMIYDRHPEQQSKWNKVFWERGYYVATVGNVTEPLRPFAVFDEWPRNPEESAVLYIRRRLIRRYIFPGKAFLVISSGREIWVIGAS